MADNSTLLAEPTRQQTDQLATSYIRPLSRWAIRALTVALMVMALLVMIGWKIDSSLLVQIYPTLVPMQFNTALCFLMSGSSLFVATTNHRSLASLGGIAVILLSGLTGAQYLLGVDFGIDQFFAEHHITTLTSNPGRMSPNSSIGFILVGLAIVLEAFLWEDDYFHARYFIFGGIILALSGVAIVGYITQVRTSYGWAYSGMALHTSVAFFLIGLCIVSLAYQHHELSIIQRKRLTAFFVFIFSISVVYFSAQLIKSKEVSAYHEQFYQRTAEIANDFSQRNLALSEALERQMARWHVSNDTDQLARDFQYYLSDFPQITQLSLMRYDGDYSPLMVANPQLPLLVGLDNWVQSFRDNINEEPHYTFGNDDYLYIINQVTWNNVVEILVATIDVMKALELVANQNILNSFSLRVAEPSVTLPTDDWLGVTFKHPIAVDNWNKALLFENPAKSLYSNTLFWWWNLLEGTFFAIAITGSVYYFLKLKVQRNNLDLIINTAASGLIGVNHAGRIVMVNSQAEILFGYPRNELLGKDIEILVPIDADVHGRMRQSFITKGKIRRMGIGVLHGRTKQGALTPLEVNLTFMNDASEPLVLATISDIREREQFTTKLKQQNEQLKHLFESMEEGIYLQDSEGLTTFINKSACDMLGYDESELLGLPIHNFVHHSYPDGKPYPLEESPIFDSLKTGVSHNVSTEVFWRKDNQPVAVSYTSTPILGDSQSIGVMVAFHGRTGSASSTATH